MGVGREIIYLLKAAFFGLAAIILIPKEHYKKYLVYGLLLGGINEILAVVVLSRLLHLFRYKNLGVFNILNLFSFWTPLAWMFVVMYFLYALPRKRLFLYPYVAGYGVFGYFLGLVLHNFGLFEYNGIFIYFAPFALTAWFALIAWLYIKAERIEIK